MGGVGWGGWGDAGSTHQSGAQASIWRCCLLNTWAPRSRQDEKDEGLAWKGCYHFGTHPSGCAWMRESGKCNILPIQEEN